MKILPSDEGFLASTAHANIIKPSFVATETERKYLVNKEMLPQLTGGEHIIQAYLHISRQVTVRVRFTENSAFITVKGSQKGISRPEFEYPIPLEDAFFMAYELSPFAPVRKTRFQVIYCGKTWQIDEFEEQNAGLWVAEIELSDPDEIFELPPWIAEEVSGDSRYQNSTLAQKPFSEW